MHRVVRPLLAPLAAAPLLVTMTPDAQAASHAPAAHVAASSHTARATTAGHPGQAAHTQPTRRRASAQARYTNWAGYQLATPSPTQAHASWFVPSVRWPGRDGYSNAWVGLGGGNAAQGQLIQAGTEHDIVCSAVRSGRCTAWRTQYYAWIETFPDRAQERITNLAIAPGDAVEATVRWSAPESRAYFTLCNWRTDQCVGTSRATSSPKGVSQFIVERPMLGNGRVAALANFGTVRFSGADVKAANGTLLPKQTASTRISMFNGRQLATPGALSNYGDSFPVTFNRAA